MCITKKRNEQKIQIMSKPEISQEILLEFSKKESTGSCTFRPQDLPLNPSTNVLYNQRKVPIPRSLVPIFKKAIIVHRQISVSNGSNFKILKTTLINRTRLKTKGQSAGYPQALI